MTDAAPQSERTDTNATLHGPNLRLVGDAGNDAGDIFVSAHAWLIGVTKSGRLAPLSPAGRSVLMVYLAHANRDLIAWPREQTIRDALACSADTVSRGRREILDAGLADALVIGGGTKSWRLRLRRELAADLTPGRPDNDQVTPPGSTDTPGITPRREIAQVTPPGKTAGVTPRRPDDSPDDGADTPRRFAGTPPADLRPHPPQICGDTPRRFAGGRSPSKKPSKKESIDGAAPSMGDGDGKPDDEHLFAERAAIDALTDAGFGSTDAANQVRRHGPTVIQHAIAQVRDQQRRGKRIRSAKRFLMSTITGIVNGEITVPDHVIEAEQKPSHHSDKPCEPSDAHADMSDVEWVRRAYKRHHGEHAARVRALVADMRRLGWDSDRTCQAIDAMLESERASLFEDSKRVT